MSVLQAILLGIVQGITEFLPVSSFGHLAAIENAMGITRNTAVLFEVLLHIGTMVAVFFAFHEDLRRIGEELLGMIMDIIGNVNIYFHNRKTGENLHYARVVHGTYRKFTAIMAVSFIPTALLGYICRRLVTRAAISPLLPGACILVTGVFLLVTDLSNIGGIKTDGCRRNQRVRACTKGHDNSINVDGKLRARNLNRASSSGSIRLAKLHTDTFNTGYPVFVICKDLNRIAEKIKLYALFFCVMNFLFTCRKLCF